MKSRGLNQQLHITHRWILTLCLTVFITPLIAFSQSQETGKMAFFDAHLNRTLAGLDFLSMPAGHQIRSQIAVQFANLNQLSEDQINKAYENGFLPARLLSKDRWLVLNESEIIGIRIHQRDRDRLHPYDWQLTRRVEMERNEHRQMTMLKERTGDPDDASFLITYFEYDERGYPTRQIGYMSNGVSQIPYLDMRIDYDQLGRVEQIRERYYNIMGNQRSDSVSTRFQYQGQDMSSLRIENGFHGHMHSDTTRTMFQEGSGNEPLRLMIHRSFMVQDGNNGQYQRERTRYRYTYPTLSTILDYLIKQTYYYDMAPFELEEYNDGTGEYEILERLTQVIEQGFTTLQAETWQSGSGWILGDLWYIHLNERSKPDFIEVYDQSRLSPYLFEAHEITSEFATTVDQIEQNPNSVLLYQNYPNPFNPQTEIIFELNESDWVTLSVFDALGRKVRTLVDQVLSSGRHQATFDANFLPTGLYYYQLQTGEEMITRTMIYLK